MKSITVILQFRVNFSSNSSQQSIAYCNFPRDFSEQVQQVSLEINDILQKVNVSNDIYKYTWTPQFPCLPILQFVSQSANSTNKCLAPKKPLTKNLANPVEDIAAMKPKHRQPVGRRFGRKKPVRKDSETPPLRRAMLEIFCVIFSQSKSSVKNRYQTGNFPFLCKIQLQSVRQEYKTGRRVQKWFSGDRRDFWPKFHVQLCAGKIFLMQFPLKNDKK